MRANREPQRFARNLLALLALSAQLIAWGQQRAFDDRLQRSWALMDEAPDSALYYAEVAAELARAEGDSAGLALAFRRIALCLERDQRPQEGMRYLEAAWRIDDRMGNTRALISDEQKMATLLAATGNRIEAIPPLERALGRSRQLGDAASEARCLSLLAQMHQQIGQYEEGVRTVFESMGIRKRLGDEEGMAACMNTLAGLYMSMGRTGQAEQALHEYMALQRGLGSPRNLAAGFQNLSTLYGRMERPAEMLAYADSALAMHHAIDDSAGVLHAMLAKAGAQEALGDHAAAKRTYEAVMASARLAGDEETWATAAVNLSGLLLGAAQPSRAEQLLREALRWARQAGNRSFELDATDALANLLRERGRTDEALTLYLRARELRDSIFTDRANEAFATADSRERYAAGQREERIKELQLEVALRDEQRRRRTYERNALLMASAGLLLVIGLILRTLQQRRRIAVQQANLHRRQVEALLSEQEVLALQAMLDGQQQERGRIAQDLHDRLGSALSAIRMRLSPLVDNGHGGQMALPDGAKVLGMVDDAVAEVRRISHNLADTALARSGLAAALEKLADRLRSPGRMEVELSLHGMEQRLDQTLEIALYKIVQELVANTLRHADASRLSISALRGEGAISLIVEDDGKGFQPEGASKGMGLKGVRERAAGIGASVRWDSGAGRGTTVVVEVPLGRAPARGAGD